MAKPLEKPNFATGATGSNIATPSAGERTSGWTVGKPARQFANYIAKWSSAWLDYFEAETDDYETHKAATQAHGATGAVMGTTNVQQVSGKSLEDTSTFFVNVADATKKLLFNLAGGTTGKKTTIAAAPTLDRTWTLPDASDTAVGKDTAALLKNKTLEDATTEIVDSADPTKKIGFDAVGTTGTKTTIQSSQTANRTIITPDLAGTVILDAGAQDVSDKNVANFLGFTAQGSVPATPAAGKIRVYRKTTGGLWEVDEAGLDIPVSSAPGSPMPWPGPLATIPARHLHANGALISRSTYAALFSAIGCQYGAGDLSTTFALPDWRGVALRGVDGGRNYDPDRASRTSQQGGTTFTGAGNTTNGSSTITNLLAATVANAAIGSTITGTGIPGSTYVLAKLSTTSLQLSNNASATNTGVTFTFSSGALGDYVGSYQGDTYLSHAHNQQGYISSGGGGSWSTMVGAYNGGSLVSLRENTSSAGGNETRMKNVNVHWLIRF